MRDAPSPEPDDAERPDSRRVVLTALGGNLAIAVTKFVAFLVTGSTAMLTEAIHSLVDTGDQLLLLTGQVRARKPADASHPFGYGMETYFWTFIVALMIFLAGGAVAIWQGVDKVMAPHPVTLPLVNFGVLAISAVAEGLSFRTAYRAYRQTVRRRPIRLLGFLRLSKDPNVFATLLEDGAALMGLGLAALGVIGSSFLGAAWADGAASIAIGLLLVTVAAFMANETRSLIAGEAAAPAIVDRARTALKDCADLGELISLKTLHLGPQSILVAVRWRFTASLSRAEVEQAMAEIERRVCAADPRIFLVVFEPGRAR